MDSITRLVAALTNEKDPRLEGTIRKARRGDFCDTLSSSAMPVYELVMELERLGFPKLAQRAKEGEFEATAAEWDAWERSPEGMATLIAYRQDRTYAPCETPSAGPRGASSPSPSSPSSSNGSGSM